MGVLGGTWVVVWSSLERPWGCLGSSWGPLGGTWGFLCGLLATQSLKYAIKTNGFSSILKSILSNFCMLFGTQKRPKSSPGAPRGRPRDARGSPRSLQGSPKRHPRHPRGAPGELLGRFWVPKSMQKLESIDFKIDEKPLVLIAYLRLWVAKRPQRKR